MKKITLVLSLVALTLSCSADEETQRVGTTVEPTCTCEAVHRWYYFVNGGWQLLPNMTTYEPATADCDTDGHYESQVHTYPNINYLETITIECD